MGDAMTTTINFAQGGPEYVWSELLLDVLNLGTYNVSLSTSDDIFLEFGALTLQLSGAALVLSGGEITAGNISSLKLQDGSETIVTVTLDAATSAADFHDDLVGQNFDHPAMLTALLTLFGASAVEGLGSPDYDTIYGGLANDSLLGGEGHDELYGNAGDDSLEGGEDNDRLTGGSGMDTLKGGSGWDDARYNLETGTQGVIVNLSQTELQEGGATLQGGEAKDTFGDTDTLDGIEFIGGTANADFIRGSDDEDDTHFYMGGEGADTFHGGNGFDGIAYDIEEIEGGGEGVIVNLSDETKFGVASMRATDTYGDTDELRGSIEGVAGSHDSDTIIGGDNDNRLWGRDGDDRVQGEDGDDQIEGDDGNDTLVGGRGSDKIQGGRGDDELQGDNEDGSGWAEDEDNGDTSYYDTLSYENETGGEGIELTVFNGEATDTYGDKDRFSGFERYRGSQYDDEMTGWVNDETFSGLKGDDTIIGGGGRDRVDYSDDQYFEGGAGNGVIVNLGEIAVIGPYAGQYVGEATDGFGDTDVLVDISDVVGSEFADTITGNDLRNRVDAGDGDDSVVGGGGDDQLRGDGGNDTLEGGNGRDQLEGGDGDDDLMGGNGSDQLDGGRGDDSMSGGKGDDDFAPGSGEDTIDGGDGYDRIRFDGYDAGDEDHEDTSVTVSLNDADLGSGTVSGQYGDDGNGNPAAVATTFSNIERIFLSRGDDTFNATGDFNGTVESDGVARNVPAMVVIGGDGADEFDITNGKVIIDYDEEQWGQDGFNRNDERRWGDQQLEYGVAINLSGTAQNITLTTRDDGDIPLVLTSWASGQARDLYGNIDLITAASAFRLTDSNDVVYLSNLDSWIDARAGNDYIVGGAGDDEIYGEEGNDTLEGGEGDDNLNGSQGEDVISGGDGNDNLRGGDDNDHISGGDDDDELEGDRGEDELFGGAGNDNLRGGDDDDSLDGGDGNDRLEGDNGDDLLEGGEGDDRLNGGNDQDTLLGGDGDDRLEGQNGNDWLDGGEGDDRLRGDDGDDTLIGGDGDDELEGGWGGGYDVISGDLEVQVNNAGTITNRADLEDGLEPGGNDSIWGGDGEDLIFGGGGNDEIDGDDDADEIYGGAGYDTLRGGNGMDEIHGGAGNDRIEGGDDWDWIDGGSGHDNINGDDGNDSLSGGDGNDHVHGGNGDDTLKGDGGNDTLGGGDGNDRLIADSGDRLYGDNGNDTYVLGGLTSIRHMWDSGGIDTIETSITRNLTEFDPSPGGDGFDFFDIENATVSGAANGTRVDLTGNDLNNTLTGHNGVNSLSGGLGNDSLVGNGGNDTLNGGENNDTLSGGDNNDSLLGGNGNDSLLGGAGNDILLGGNNNDTLVGGAGKDTMTGGANNDRFVFLSTGDSGTSASTRDIILDFVKGQDKIDLSAIDAKTVKDSGNDSFSSKLVKGTASTSFGGKQGTIIWYQENNSGSANDRTIIRINTDTDNSNEMTIELKGLINLAASDFIL